MIETEMEVMSSLCSTHVFSDASEIREIIGDKVKTGTNVEEFTFSVREGLKN